MKRNSVTSLLDRQDAPLIQHIAVNEDNDDNFQAVTDHRFKWFHCCLHYNFMWIINTPKGWNKTKVCNIMAFLCLILFLFFTSYIWLIRNGIFISSLNIGYVSKLMYKIIYFTWQLLFLLMRYSLLV